MTDSSEAPESPRGESKKSKKKVRSVWISFGGRIAAQILGAVASVTLGIMILQKHQKVDAEMVRPIAHAAPAVARVANKAEGARALAVLPLDSYSPDAGDEYFANGMTEALIADLARLDGLRVISRTSAMRYRMAGKSVPEIARELDVDLVIEGSVVKTGGHVRVTAQLIDARADEHLWARSYDRTSADVLAVQADVASAIARDVRAAVTPAEP